MPAGEIVLIGMQALQHCLDKPRLRSETGRGQPPAETAAAPQGLECDGADALAGDDVDGGLQQGAFRGGAPFGLCFAGFRVHDGHFIVGQQIN